VIRAREEEKNGPVGNGWGEARGARDDALTAGRGGALAAGRGGLEGSAPGRGGFPDRLIRPASAPVSVQTAAQVPSKTGLHPSWEAAKLRKAKEIAAAPKAIKIVFD